MLQPTVKAQIKIIAGTLLANGGPKLIRTAIPDTPPTTIIANNLISPFSFISCKLRLWISYIRHKGSTEAISGTKESGADAAFLIALLNLVEDPGVIFLAGMILNLQEDFETFFKAP
ncbi:hypothetical protein RUND412_002366 [Rhizina undulata]